MKTRRQRILAALTLGFDVGIITGIFGAGGGLMITLILVFILDYPIHLAIGTSTIIMAITALSGMLGYTIHGNIKGLAGLALGATVALAATLASKYANTVNEKALSKIVAAVFIALGAAMITLRVLAPTPPA